MKGMQQSGLGHAPAEPQHDGAANADAANADAALRLGRRERLAALSEFPRQQQAEVPQAQCDAYRSWAFPQM